METMKESSMSIYVIGSHQKKFFSLDDIREKFYVDDKHDNPNIDAVNPYFCELTGLYYMWRHCSDPVVGLEHYRRFLSVDGVTPINSEMIHNILKLPDVDVLCNVYNYKDRPALYAASENLFWIHKFLCFCEVLHGDTIKPYTEFAAKYVSGHELIVGNIFISRQDFFQEYCSFLFPSMILFYKAELAITKDIASRIMGYIAEYLFGAYIRFHKKRIFRCKLVKLP